ncbi:MAG TPA: V-type ATPase 116kDa subunit family protein [Bacillota bacterium]|nr:V-type ATPase 116kDa subunit family protein [Bacillota bacterium]HPZ53761.1 V-type ATPase 116kDa subunit family protein [Bacillota bacterium]HQD17269.1 V-type ATPase 116kDa subunit family protein [Bacillota bacterium]
MAIASMKKIEVIGHLDCKDAVLRTLQTLGVVEVEDITHMIDGCEGEDGDLSLASTQIFRADDSNRLAAIEDKISVVRSSLQFIERLSPRKKSLMEQFTGYQVPLTQSQLDEYISDTDALNTLIARVAELERQLGSLEGQESDLAQALEQMMPWASLEIPVESLCGTRHTTVLVGVADGEHLHELLDQVEEACEGTAVVTVVSQSRQTARLVVVVHRDHEDDVLSVLRSHGFSNQSFPFNRGLVSEFVEKTRDELGRVRAQIDEVKREVRALDGEKSRLWAVLDAYEIERDRFLVTERLVRTKKVFALLGWSKADECNKIEKALAEIDDALVVTIKDPAEGDDPPVVLVNNRLTRPFEVILDLYSLPKADEIDPTAAVSFFFALFFAMAAADFGYGVVLALTSYVLLRKVRMSDLGRKTFELLFISGVAAAAFGLITGGFFGASLGYSLISPTEDPIAFIALSLGLGIVHLYAGMIIEFYDNVRRGQVMAGLFDQGLWLLLLTSLIVLGLQSQTSINIPLGEYAGWVAAASAVGLVLTQGRHQSNLLLRLGSGLASLYDISGYFSDVLSYTRLLGLGMASGVIATVINLVASMFWSTPVIGPVVTIVIMVFGHVFNLFIGVIGGYVHVSRLQYIEFFGKFFEGGGRAFSPLKAKSRYVYVTDTQQQGG